VSGNTVVDRREIHVVSVGYVGPPGPAGAQTRDDLVVSESVPAYRAVAGDGLGTLSLASNTNAAHRDCVLGVTETAAIAGDAVRMRWSGTISFAGWSWTPQTPIFVGNNGQLTQVAPASPALFSQVIAVALTATSIEVRLREPITIL
jgi:hypothetical protein